MLDRAALARAVARHGAVVRVMIAAHKGSSPREAGAAMLVWAGGEGFGQEGTIGGGALEWQAAERARRLLGRDAPEAFSSPCASTGSARPPPRAGASAHPRGWSLPVPASNMLQFMPSLVQRLPLGPALGQCCGGAVTLAYEVIDAAALAAIPQQGLHARRVEGSAEMPLAIARALRDARGQGRAKTIWKAGWLAEPVAPQAQPLWVWGAGHVGRAIVGTLAPLPDFAITWVDTTLERFPTTIPPGVAVRHAPDPADLVASAPADARHLILTFSHALDLELCHRLLLHGFASAGLIGSQSKAARFRTRLRALGHADAQIARIRCPIGDPGLGKHPQAIALGVGAALLKKPQAHSQTERAG